MLSRKKYYEGWQDSVELVILVWLFVSPFVLGFNNDIIATNTALLIGATACLFVQLGIARQEPWEEWVTITLSLILIISPWVFSYADNVVATANAIICGSLIIIFAVASLKHEHEEMNLGQHR